MGLNNKDISNVLAYAGTTPTFHDMIIIEKKMRDSMKYMENTHALSALMESQIKKLKLYDPTTKSWHHTPDTVKEAMSGPDRNRWRQAIEEELKGLMDFGTFELVNELPRFDLKGNRVRPMGTKTVLKLKTDAQGQVSRWKARVVAKGFLSREGIEHDTDEVFSPVVAYPTFRTILSIAAGYGWRIKQTDISQAYLQGRLVDSTGAQREIYMEDPLERTDPKTGSKIYLKLLRPIYGLKQSGFRFCEELHSHLEANGFVRMESDSCLFKLTKPRHEIDPSCTDKEEVSTLICGSYVDDIVFTGSDDTILSWFDEMLKQRFHTNPHDTGEINHMLGARITYARDKGYLRVDQTAAIEALAKRFQMHESAPKAMYAWPMGQEPLLKLKETQEEYKEFPYLSAVGSLLHISMLTRPDISYAVGSVARHGAAFGKQHVQAVRRIIGYLYHTRHHALTYRSSESVKHLGPMKLAQDAVMYEAGRPPIMNEHGQAALRADPLHVYCDADFAGDTTKRSTSGMITFLNGGPIMWSSRLQKLQALSTTESEIYSAVEAIRDASILRLQLTELGVRPDEPIPIHEDNSACITMGMTYLKKFNNARHYVTRLNFLQERLHDGTCKMVMTPTKEQIADALTKPLGRVEFEKFRDIMVQPVPIDSPG